MATSPVTCPERGRDARLEGADRQFGASSFVVEPRAVDRHQLIRAVIERQELPGRLGRWLQDIEAIGRPTNISTRLLFFPFWAIPDGPGTRVEPAAAWIHPGPRLPSLPSGDVETFRDDLVGSADLVPTTVPLSLVAARTKPLETRRGAAAKARLVHVPFWEISYRIRGIGHLVWIDAAAGQVLPLSIPPSSERWLDCAYAAVMAGTFLAIFSGFLAITSRSAPAVLLGLALLAGGGPAGWWAARRLICRTEGS